MERFEDKLERLEKISTQIRSAGVPLEEAVSLFEEGITLTRELEEQLQSIETRVQILTSSPEDEQAVFTPFDQRETENHE